MSAPEDTGLRVTITQFASGQLVPLRVAELKITIELFVLFYIFHTVKCLGKVSRYKRKRHSINCMMRDSSYIPR